MVAGRLWILRGTSCRSCCTAEACEVRDDAATLATMRARLAERFPLDDLRAAKRKLDPKGVLGNTLIDTLLAE